MISFMPSVCVTAQSYTYRQDFVNFSAILPQPGACLTRNQNGGSIAFDALSA
jgi:hypothetical protein